MIVHVALTVVLTVVLTRVLTRVLTVVLALEVIEVLKCGAGSTCGLLRTAIYLCA
jgi:hypothetical protein